MLFSPSNITYITLQEIEEIIEDSDYYFKNYGGNFDSIYIGQYEGKPKLFVNRELKIAYSKTDNLGKLVSILSENEEVLDDSSPILREYGHINAKGTVTYEGVLYGLFDGIWYGSGEINDSIERCFILKLLELKDIEPDNPYLKLFEPNSETARNRYVQEWLHIHYTRVTAKVLNFFTTAIAKNWIKITEAPDGKKVYSIDGYNYAFTENPNDFKHDVRNRHDILMSTNINRMMRIIYFVANIHGEVDDV